MIRSLRDRCRALAGRRQPGRAALLHQGGIEGVPGACSMPSWDGGVDFVAMEAGDDPAATSAGDYRPRLPGQTAAGPEPTAFVPGRGCPTDPVYPSRCSSRTGPDADRRPERQKKEHARRSGLICMIVGKSGAGRHSGENSRQRIPGFHRRFPDSLKSWQFYLPMHVAEAVAALQM
jgi:hypothetical protein